MTNNNLTDERLSALIRVARDSLELYEMELPVIDDVMLALAELQQRHAAMLQGADGNYPDGWVACSERMPERGVDVLACTISPIGGFEEIETAQWHGGMKGEQPVFITSADAIEPTHWMPLPAAPQQEVKHV
ncbi:TPA: DUF551 domain-containing protein [Enterobacter roggenkampii]|nr:DUF551 domain-containing protein [Enterobacter roggenkampii]